MSTQYKVILVCSVVLMLGFIVTVVIDGLQNMDIADALVIAGGTGLIVILFLYGRK